MIRIEKIKEIRKRLTLGDVTIGSWMQIPSNSVAEILGRGGYDWIAVDLEHGSISINQLPDLFRAIELGGTLPLVRVAQGFQKDCKQALDAGAGGIIIPMIKTAKQLEETISYCCWPPTGKRGVGFSRANLFGRDFNLYKEEASNPFIVAQIESYNAVQDLEAICTVRGLDALIIGPYDLSASMNLTGQFSHPDFIEVMNSILKISNKFQMPCGIHIVDPDQNDLEQKIKDGYRFIAYSIDAVFLEKNSKLNFTL